VFFGENIEPVVIAQQRKHFFVLFAFKQFVSVAGAYHHARKRNDRY
jgi:hypothetical protein